MGLPVTFLLFTCDLHSVYLWHSYGLCRLRIDKDYNGFLVPNPRPARELLEQNEAFEMAASESSVDVLAPISLTDLAVTLKVSRYKESQDVLSVGEKIEGSI